MTLEEKIYEYFMSDKFRAVGLSEAASDIAKLQGEVIEAGTAEGDFGYNLGDKLVKYYGKKVIIRLEVEE